MWQLIISLKSDFWTRTLGFPLRKNWKRDMFFIIAVKSFSVKMKNVERAFTHLLFYSANGFGIWASQKFVELVQNILVMGKNAKFGSENDLGFGPLQNILS